MFINKFRFRIVVIMLWMLSFHVLLYADSAFSRRLCTALFLRDINVILCQTKQKNYGIFIKQVYSLLSAVSWTPAKVAFTFSTCALLFYMIKFISEVNTKCFIELSWVDNTHDGKIPATHIKCKYTYYLEWIRANDESDVFGCSW